MIIRGASKDVLFTQDDWQLVTIDSALDVIGSTGLDVIARHTCSVVQRLGGGTEDVAYIYRYTSEGLWLPCQYCESEAPDQVKTLFRLMS